ncbi:MAG: hypothetical protein LC107_04555 [Chitinophagales bacterium]|nr:hypothetical protein [Chitinophagales bacterium]
MKRFVYMLVMMTSMMACKSVSKMVEKGEYDKAFDYSIKKLTGEKNKKTEYVKALEKAYTKLNTATLKEVERLNASAKPENWPKVLQLYNSIDKRQDKLEPLLPLVSVDGYVASFDMRSYSNEIMDAEDKASAYHYSNALALLDRAEKIGDKSSAKSALSELQKIEKIKLNYKDTQRQKDKAIALGITRVNIQIYNGLRDFHSDNIERSLYDMSLAKLDKTWLDFSYNSRDAQSDYIVEVALNEIFFSPERERLHTYSESKEILISKDQVKGDSTTIEKQVYEKVKADITELFREKQSELHGNIRIINARTSKVMKTVPVNVYFDFKGYSCQYIGDKRALTDETNKKLDNYIEPFPSDFVLADNLAAAFQDAVVKELKNFKFE